MKTVKLTKLIVAITILITLTASSKVISAQTTYSTGFEPPVFTLGDVNGQNGWGYFSNSPTKGVIESAPAGSSSFFEAQSLAIRTNNVDFFGVANHLYSATVDPAGEPGSTLGGTVVASPYNHFAASFYYQAPSTPVISTLANGRFAELNPSSKGTGAGDYPNRYAQVRVVNDTNTAAGKLRFEIGWYTFADQTFMVSTVAENLNWGEWYRLDYDITFYPGLNGTSPNDVFRLSIYDLNNNLLGTATGSTWETAYKTGNFGGGNTARAVNGFDFWSRTGPNNALVGYIDNFSESVNNLAATASSVTVSGRVMKGRRGISQAKVSLTDQNGETRTVLTNSLGYYRFVDTPAGQSYTISVSAKKYTFTQSAQALSLVGETDDINFVADN
ncbi:MAG TPA: carboxypeptidase-like regulatory domain-containing protein [Pyrinomonadaceae bacterium]